MVEEAKMLRPKLTVVGVPSNMSEDEIISVICDKDERLNQLVESGETLEVAKFWDIKTALETCNTKKLL